VLLVVVGIALALTWPRTLGGQVSYTMVAGHSMEPTMHYGDLAVLRSRHTYRVGDVIAYRVPSHDVGGGSTVIHRIVGGSGQTGFTTRGDNNSYDDVWHPKTGDVVGARWVLLPGVATAFTHLRGPLPLALFAAGLAAMAACREGALPRRRRRRRAPRAPAVA
jgi:signal peptidase